MSALGDLLSKNVGKGATACDSDSHHGSRLLSGFFVHCRVRHSVRELRLAVRLVDDADVCDDV